jgi:hypothetical protein
VNAPAAPLCIVQIGDGGLGLTRKNHLDESEASRTARLAVGCNSGGGNLAVPLEAGAEIVRGHGVRQILAVNVSIIAHGLFPKKENRARGTTGGEAHRAPAG